MQTPLPSSSSSPSSFNYYDIPSGNMNGSKLYSDNTPTAITVSINTQPQISQQQLMPINTISVDPILTTGVNNSSQTNELRNSFHERQSLLNIIDLQPAKNSAYGMAMTMSGSFREIATIPPVTQQHYEKSNTMATDTNLYMTPSSAINLGLMTTNVSFYNSFLNSYQDFSLPHSSHIDTPRVLQPQINCTYTGAPKTENKTFLEVLQQDEVIFPDVLINDTTAPITSAYRQTTNQQEQQERFRSSTNFGLKSSSSLPPQQITQQVQQQSLPGIPTFPSASPVKEAWTDINQQSPTTKENEEKKILDYNTVDINSLHFHLQSDTHSLQINDPQPRVQSNAGSILSSPPLSPTEAIIDQDSYFSTPSKDHQHQGGNDNTKRNTNNNQQKEQQGISAIGEASTKRIKQQEMQQTTKVYLNLSDTNNTKIQVNPDVLTETQIKEMLSQNTNFASSSSTAPASIPLKILKQMYGKGISATTKIDNSHGNIQLSASLSSSPSSSSEQPVIPLSNNNQSVSSHRGGITDTDFISKQMPLDITRKSNTYKRKHYASSTESSFFVGRFITTLTCKNKNEKQQWEGVFNVNINNNDKKSGENEEIKGRQCHHCLRVVSRARDLNRHIMTHNKSYLASRCKRCGRPYKRKDSVLRHNKNCS